MNYNIIVATCANNGGIGYKNQLPWPHNSADMKHFAKLTKGSGNNAIVMGRKTWESLPHGPLPKRDNIVMSRSLEKIEGGWVYSSLEEVINHCTERKYEKVWVIGGAQIYNIFLEKKIIQEIYKTVIPGDYECDCFFPEVPTSSDGTPFYSFNLYEGL